MAPAPLYAHARSTRWRLIRLLSSVALAPCAIVSAYAQATAPAAPSSGSGAQPTSETRSMNGTTVSGSTDNGGGTVRPRPLGCLDYTTVPGIGAVQDEDVVRNNGGTWSVYFDGTAAGLTSGNLDVDAFDVP